MGLTVHLSPNLVFSKVKDSRKYTRIPSLKTSLLERDVKNGIPFRLQPWKHGTALHFSVGFLMFKETILNNLGSAVLKIRNHHSVKVRSSADCVQAAKCEETM